MKSNVKQFLFTLALLSAALAAPAQSWTNFFGGNAIALDGSGNVIVAGGATVKCSSAGVPLWTNLSGIAAYLAVDGGGNVIVTGSSEGSNGTTDFTTIKYSSAGVPLWTNRYSEGVIGPPGGPTDIVVDSGGNVIVAGYS
jgi:hypothetical protein